MRLDDLDLLCCPDTRRALRATGGSARGTLADGVLATEDGARRYEVTGGIARLLPERMAQASAAQRAHYDRMGGEFLAARRELDFTARYWRYLGDRLVAACGPVSGGAVLEICCGSGGFLAERFPEAAHRVGVDISEAMLRGGAQDAPVSLICGDATRLPLRDSVCDLVYLHGGVHHVPDRGALFREIFRVLKPGGRMACLEPVDDFFLARWARRLIYRWSDLLDPETEQPLRAAETARQLRDCGFVGFGAAPCSYLAGAFFANTDVLGFMRHFDRMPGHRFVAASLTAVDDIWRRIPVLRGMSLLATMRADKPAVRRGGAD